MQVGAAESRFDLTVETDDGTASLVVVVKDPDGGSGGSEGCTSGQVTVRHSSQGIASVTVQGIGTWQGTGASTLDLGYVTVGLYTVYVTTTAGTTESQTADIGCGSNTIWFKT